MTNHVYFVKCMDSIGLVKIGRASCVQKRVAELATACPHTLKILYSHAFKDEASARRAELLAHKTFDFCRRRGEWFSANSELRNAIASLSAGADFEFAMNEAWSLSKKKRDQVDLYRVKKTTMKR